MTSNFKIHITVLKRVEKEILVCLKNYMCRNKSFGMSSFYKLNGDILK